MKLSDRAHLIRCGLAGPEDLDGLSREDLLAIKSDQSEVHYRFLSGDHAVDCIKAAGATGTKPRFRHVASDESVDAVGDIIRVAGWDLERFQKNPVLLWAHDQRALPLGIVDRVWKGQMGGGRALLTESVFHPAELNPMAEMVGKLVEAGALPGVSVGFIPKEYVFPENQKERQSLGLGDFGILHVRQTLIELSVVPVPANGNALQRKAIELAEPILSDERWEREMVEVCRRYFNLETDAQRELRRRTILVMGDGEARAKRLDQEPQPELPKPLPGSAAGPRLPQPQAISLDERSIAAIEALHDSVDALVEHLTKDGTVATGEPNGNDPPRDPAGPGEAFVADVQRTIESLDFSRK